MITCFILEDEPSSLDHLKKYIARTPILQLIGEETKPELAIEKILQFPPELIFLDIQMPGYSGLDIAEQLPKACKVIFTTAYKDFAADAFDKNAVDFLSKPFSYERFCTAVRKIMDMKKTNKIPLVGKGADFFYINGGKKGLSIKINHMDLLFLESNNHYSVLHLTGKRKYIVAFSLCSIEEKLPEYFKRIQRSFIVNFQKIDRVEGNSIVFPEMEKEIIVGVEYREILKNFLASKSLH